MNKLNFYLIHYTDVFKSVNIQPNTAHISEYLNGGREDILENFDIFCENVRSKNKVFKNFSLFNKINNIEDGCVIVIGFYLELLEFWGCRNRIHDVVKFYCEKYPTNKIVVTWNHDINASQIFTYINEFKNLYVLNFNTSVNHDRFILLPFWTIDDILVKEEKKYLCNLVCSFNNQIRVNLKNIFIDNPNFYVSDRLNFDLYKKILSSSKFTLSPKGLGLSSYRFFECFHLNTIPVLFANDVILPYQNKINYNEFIIRIDESKSKDPAYIIDILTNVDYEKMLNNMNNVRELFTLKGAQEEIYNRLI